MEFSQSEVKIINESIRFVNRWRWYKYTLLALLISLIYFCGHLIFNENDGRLSGLISVVIGLIIGYLGRNWSEPKKETLLLKLVKNHRST